MLRLMCLSLALLVFGCAGSLESTVHDARVSHRYPASLSVRYDDRTPLLGGDRIEVDPDGHVRWWQDVPTPISAGGAPEDTFDDVRRMPDSPARAPDIAGTVSAEALGRLLEIIDAIAPWARRPADDNDDGRVERRRALIDVRNGASVASAWQWADPTESGDERITSVRRWAEVSVQRPPRVVEPVEEPVEQGPNPVLSNP